MRRPNLNNDEKKESAPFTIFKKDGISKVKTQFFQARSKDQSLRSID